jgi:hypothetical protein
MLWAAWPSPHPWSHFYTGARDAESTERIQAPRWASQFAPDQASTLAGAVSLHWSWREEARLELFSTAVSRIAERSDSNHFRLRFQTCLPPAITQTSFFCLWFPRQTSRTYCLFSSRQPHFTVVYNSWIPTCTCFCSLFLIFCSS